MIEESTNNAIDKKKYLSIISNFGLIASDLLEGSFNFPVPLEFFSGHELLQVKGVIGDELICLANREEEVRLSLDRFTSTELQQIFETINSVLEELFDVKINGTSITYPSGITTNCFRLSSLYEHLLSNL